MEEKKIKIIINNESVELESNNPDLKKLVDLIIKQDDNYDYKMIDIETKDEKFDKEGFKDILIQSIADFKKNVQLVENTSLENTKKLSELKNLIEKSI